MISELHWVLDLIWVIQMPLQLIGECSELAWHWPISSSSTNWYGMVCYMLPYPWSRTVGPIKEWWHTDRRPLVPWYHGKSLTWSLLSQRQLHFPTFQRLQSPLWSCASDCRMKNLDIFLCALHIFILACGLQDHWPHERVHHIFLQWYWELTFVNVCYVTKGSYLYIGVSQSASEDLMLLVLKAALWYHQTSTCSSSRDFSLKFSNHWQFTSAGVLKKVEK